MISEITDDALLIAAIRYCFFENKRSNSSDAKKYTGTQNLFASYFGLTLKDNLLKRRIHKIFPEKDWGKLKADVIAENLAASAKLGFVPFVKAQLQAKYSSSTPSENHSKLQADDDLRKLFKANHAILQKLSTAVESLISIIKDSKPNAVLKAINTLTKSKIAEDDSNDNEEDQESSDEPNFSFEGYDFLNPIVNGKDVANFKKEGGDEDTSDDGFEDIDDFPSISSKKLNPATKKANQRKNSTSFVSFPTSSLKILKTPPETNTSTNELSNPNTQNPAKSTSSKINSNKTSSIILKSSTVTNIHPQKQKNDSNANQIKRKSEIQLESAPNIDESFTKRQKRASSNGVAAAIIAEKLNSQDLDESFAENQRNQEDEVPKPNKA